MKPDAAYTTYVPALCTIRAVRPLSVEADFNQARTPKIEWLPRALLHPDDDKALDGAFTGEPRTLRILKWKADALGLTCRKNETAAVADLFGPTA